MNHLEKPTTASEVFAQKERLWFFGHRSAAMQWTPEEIVTIILEQGPFSEGLVLEWPEEMRKDYLELLGLDLTTMGLEEFTRLSRSLGEAYLLSLDKCIESDGVLLKSWKIVTGGERPPRTPSFNES